MGLYRGELQQNILVCGRAGSGKTNLAYIIIQGLLEEGIPFWAIDFKRDYRHLLRMTRDVLIFNPGSLPFNAMRPPPGTHPANWLQTFCEIFCEVFFPSTSSSSKNLLLRFCDELY